MKTYWLTGDINYAEYGGKWITKKLNNGDWDYWLIIELINMDEHCSEYEHKYITQITAISPKAAGWKAIRSALRSCGIRFKDFRPEFLKHGGKKRLILESLSNYGISAPLDSFTGNNYRDVLRRARKALPAITGMFGFFMDGSKNLLGHNGWDFISGNLGFDNLPDHYTPNMHVEV